MPACSSTRCDDKLGPNIDPPCLLPHPIINELSLKGFKILRYVRTFACMHEVLWQGVGRLNILGSFDVV